MIYEMQFVKYVLDIPVYRIAESEFDTQWEANRQSHIDSTFSVHDPADHPEIAANVERHFDSRYGGPWQFNQIVGWIRLFVSGPAIGAYLWWVDARRLNRRIRNKTFYLHSGSTLFGPEIDDADDSSTIYKRIRHALERVKSEEPIKGRHVDLSQFEFVGPCIDWRRLLTPD